ncbi:hypothetical protein ABZ502_34155 [Streptomyces abikoensis]|uniref:hypothetical protein n=1 Tax=Streptomyces abikoensis TaxID=97398 RepID=UPI0033CAB28B
MPDTTSSALCVTVDAHLNTGGFTEATVHQGRAGIVFAQVPAARHTWATFALGRLDAPYVRLTDVGSHARYAVFPTYEPVEDDVYYRTVRYQVFGDDVPYQYRGKELHLTVPLRPWIEDERALPRILAETTLKDGTRVNTIRILSVE